MNPGTLGQAALEASWQGSLVILLILFIRPLLGLRVPARWRALLWIFVLLRLLVPAFLLPPSPASLQNISVVDRPLEQAVLALNARAVDQSASPEFRSQGPAGDESMPEPPAKAPKRSWWGLVTIVWLSGAALSAIWIGAATIHLRRRIRRDSTPAEGRVEQVWSRCCASVAARRPPRLVATGCVESPALIGLWRPSLLIPRDAESSDEEWEHIFLHELAHFRRRDHWLHGLHLLALCAHWFNPLVWLGFRYLRADRELAADEWALRHLAGRRADAYGDTLLKVLTAQSRPLSTPGLVGIVEDAAQLKERLRHIVGFTPRRLFGSLAGVAAVLALAAIVLGRQGVDLAGYEGLAPAEALVVAARSNDTKALEQLVADGADVNGVANLRGERTALAAAVAGHAEEIVRLLVAKGADVNLQPPNADAPIIVALKKGWSDTAEFLRSRGATCDAETLAAAKGDAAAVQAYLTSGAPSFDKVKLLGEVAAAYGHRALFATLAKATDQHPDRQDYFPFSRGTFVTAVAHGHRGVIEELLARDPNLKRGGGVNRLAAVAAQAPGMREWLHWWEIEVPEYSDGERLIDAAEREELPEIRRLLKAGVDVNYRGESDWTPISKAATWGCPRAVKLLLESGANANTLKHGYTTLALAKTPEIASLLFAAGADVHATMWDRGVHIISYCVTHGSKEMVQWYLDHGVDPSKVKGDSPTLLFDARSPEIVELLIAHGVDVRARDDEGRTALHTVLQRSLHPAEVVAALLKHGADPNARMKGGYTPLMEARDGASVDVLVAAGADLDATDDSGKGVYNAGWGSGMPSRLEALRRHGLKLDQAKAGELLINAIQLQRDLAAVKSLLAFGPDLTLRNAAGQTALDLARLNGNEEVRALLENANRRAQPSSPSKP